MRLTSRESSSRPSFLDPELSQGDSLVRGQVAHVDIRIAVLADAHVVENIGKSYLGELLNHVVSLDSRAF
jgi:hypothetical protein